MNYEDYVNIAKDAAILAGKKIMEVYNASKEIEFESKNDNSPLTIADKKSHNTIIDILNKTNINILSEESDAIKYESRKNWDEYWLIDPLDGTKEFIKKNGEFTVNIALIKNNMPFIGIVFCPVNKILYWNDAKKNVYKKKLGQDAKKLNKRKPIDETSKNLRVVISRSHLNKDTNNYINKLNNPKLISCGSSLKFLYIADNQADIYPRFGPTMEWDTAAAHSILRSLNIMVINIEDKTELSYNKKNLLNPYFLIKP
jgi:3'(2'), 5'-bisphosphate nucleotidase|tara:strand:+ start:323 stop:1093 length:771 start_codon:yes stop_codon:yes gene_type:complete